MVKVRTFTPVQEFPHRAIFPEQTHGTRLVEIVSGSEDLSSCDGLWTRDFSRVLGVQTADCAPICFYDDQQFGIIHAGWRGLADGIIEKMLTIFSNPSQLQVHVGSLLPDFEIQRDHCYDRLHSKLGDRFFSQQSGKLIFHFREALLSLLPPLTYFDPCSTFHTPTLASWRRKHSQERNITVIGYLD